PRERPQALHADYSAWACRELTGAEVAVYPEIVTNTDEAAACAAWLRARQVDAVLLVIGAFTGDDVSCKLAQELGKPLILWATHEAPFVRQERLWANALCSAMMNNAAVKRIGGECWPVYGDKEEPAVCRQICTLVTALAAKKKLANTNLGLLGYRPTAFYNCSFDEMTIRRLFGIRMEGTELKLVFDRMAQLDPAAVRADMDAVRARFHLDSLPRLPEADRNLSEENLENHSRVYLALKQLIPEMGYDYCTIKCWPEMGAVKCQPCGVLSRLADEGLSVICEGDVDAGIGTIIEREMTGQPTFVADMINADPEANTLTFWHCGNAPLS
ncbi:MAG: fucose isomerase, partial [Blautia massiliensis (ex Durand et al. 2017)]